MTDADELVRVFGIVLSATLGVMCACAIVFVIIVVVAGFVAAVFDAVGFMRRWWRRCRRSQRKKDRE
jgi:hypothetical protein